MMRHGENSASKIFLNAFLINKNCIKVFESQYKFSMHSLVYFSMFIYPCTCISKRDLEMCLNSNCREQYLLSLDMKKGLYILFFSKI